MEPNQTPVSQFSQSYLRSGNRRFTYLITHSTQKKRVNVESDNASHVRNVHCRETAFYSDSNSKVVFEKDVVGETKGEEG